jgi:uncharacterized protein YbaR (Trm112 family)
MAGGCAGGRRRQQGRRLRRDERATGEAMADDRKVDPKLLELLVCPVTKSTLRYDAAANELISDAAKLAYPIRDGIPIMIPDEARRLEG